MANPQTKADIIPKGPSTEERLDLEKNPMTYLSDNAKDMGLILGTSPGTGILWMMPSLIITKEQVDEGLKLLEEIISETAKKFSLLKE